MNQRSSVYSWVDIWIGQPNILLLCTPNAHITPCIGGCLRVGLHRMTLIRMLSRACTCIIHWDHTHGVDNILTSEGVMGRLAPADDDHAINSWACTCIWTWIIYLCHILHDVDSISHMKDVTGRLAPADDYHGADSWAFTCTRHGHDCVALILHVWLMH